jgi:hypothetical protein
MNLWRWSISLVLLVGLVTWAGTQIPSMALGQDKDKKEEKKDDKKKDDTKKEEVKKDDKKEEKKEEKKQEKKEEKKDPPKTTGGDALVWKAFDPKAKPFTQELTTTTTQKMKVMGQDIKQEQTQTFTIKWTPGEIKDGNWTVVQKIEAINMAIDIGGNKITFDSKKKEPANPMTEFFTALLSAELTYQINPKDMNVVKVDGGSALIAKLGGANPQMESLLKTLLNDSALKQMAEPTWAAFPTSAVSKGTEWKKDSKLNLGNIGTYDTKFTYTYEGKDGKLDKINIKSALTYAAPGKEGKGERPSLPFTIKDAKELEPAVGTGFALFDADKGRFQEVNMDMKLKMKLTIEVGNMETEVILDQTQKATVKTLADDAK